jgi:hypothetical protein
MSGLRQYLRDNGVVVREAGGTSGVAIGTDIVGMAGTLVDAAIAPGTVASGSTAAAVGFVAGAASVAATAVGVWLSLGSGYAAARDAHKNERTAAGFSQGFIAGLLGWNGQQVADHFVARVIRKNAADGQMDVIDAKAFNSGLPMGYGLGSVPAEAPRKAFLREIKQTTSARAPKNWSGDENRRYRIGYVIDLAAALRKNFIK